MKLNPSNVELAGRFFSWPHYPALFEALEKNGNYSAKVHFLKSSYFEDEVSFPSGTIEFDNALLMEGIEHEWLVIRRKHLGSIFQNRP